ncbi:hypothetical protein [Luteolibacter sp. Populi]|uniref:hypothetical protein n=1 Tax=Luteolibacter sp. Populi TaxID=3230487 RepID=UPI0034662B7B
MRLSDHQLVMAAFDGELGAAEFETLQRRLKEEPELLALYREHALLHHSLTEEFEGRHPLGEGVPSVSRGPRWLLPLIAFAALFSILLGVWKCTRTEPPAASAPGGSPPERVEIPATNSHGPGVTMLEDRFDSGSMETGRRPLQGASHWRLEKGQPQIVGKHLEGSGFETYFYLPADAVSAARPVLLITVETVASSTGTFHTPGWAGFSLYQEGYEVCFFGDSYGPEETWALDVKRSLIPLMPARPVTGPRTMTFRYDRRDGTVELYEGPEPGDTPLIRSKILPGLNFDQIRIGASPEATLAVHSLRVRANEAPGR